MNLFPAEIATLAAALGAALMASGLLYSVIRSRRTGAGPFSTLLAFGACAASLVSAFGPVDVRLALTAVTGILGVAFGLLLVVFEGRRQGFVPGRSFGLLFAGAGLFICASTILVPVLPAQFILTAAPPEATTTATPTRTPLPTRTPRETATATPVPSITLSPTLLPTLTLTPTIDLPTLAAPATAAPTSAGTAPATAPAGTTLTAIASLALPTRTPLPAIGTPRPCSVVVNRNLNLRSAPSTSAALLQTVPFNTVLPVLARTSDGQWWQATYQGQTGWVSAQFVTADPSCARAPIGGVP